MQIVEEGSADALQSMHAHKKTRAPRQFQENFSVLSFCAGSLSGCVGTVVGYPLDTLKVRMQTGRRTQGVAMRALYRGMAAPLFTNGTIGALAMGIFDNCRRFSQEYIGQHPEEDHAPLSVVFFSGMGAGLTISVLTCPQNRLKVLQQSHGGSFLGTARQIGLRGLYVGYPLQAAMECGRGVYLATYFTALRFMQPLVHPTESGQATRPRTAASGVPAGMPVWSRAIAGGLAGMMGWLSIYPLDVNIRTYITGWLSIYPLDVVKSTLQAQKAGTRNPVRYTSAVECAKDLVKKEGPLRLYRGIGFTLLRAGPVAGVMLPVYDILLASLVHTFPSLT
eukprot:g68106.t1